MPSRFENIVHEQEAYERRTEAELAPLREEFDSYDPTANIIFANKPTPTLSPKFAHKFREIFGSTASDESVLKELIVSKEYKLAFGPEEKKVLSKLIGVLHTGGITNAGELREATSSSLVEMTGVGERGVVFLQTAFRKTPKQ